jgi:uncharacterized membrane protein (UPF0127 family)
MTASRLRLAPLAGTLLLAAVLAAGCGPAAGAGPSLRPEEIPPQLTGRPLAKVEIGSLDLVVAVADDNGSRTRGLTGVSDLRSLEGLLFAYDRQTDATFHMRDVPIPLDIAFVAADGSVLAVRSMPPCGSDACPRYAAPAPFRWALETRVGALAQVRVGDRFSVSP